MKIDDFMNQAGSYNTDSDTLTGFFGIDDGVAKKKTKKIMMSAVKEDKKSDIVLTIDALTESKIEAIVLTFLAISHLSEIKDNKELTAPKIAMALAMCSHDELIPEENMEKVLEVFSKVFG